MDNYPVGPESLRNGLSEFLNENIEATGLRRAILQELCYLANPTSSAGLTPPDGANSRFAAWPSVGYLAWRVGSSKSVVTKILKGLAGDGLIEIRQGGNPDRSGQRGRPGNAYMLSFADVGPAALFVRNHPELVRVPWTNGRAENVEGRLPVVMSGKPDVDEASATGRWALPEVRWVPAAAGTPGP